MKFRRSGDSYLIALERGEAFIAEMTAFCEREGIKNAFFHGLGAIERVQIGYYDLAKKEYFFRNEPGIFEVASLTGNVALVEDAPFIHAHAVLSRCDESCACIGAHIKEAYVAVTLEILLTPLTTDAKRKLNEEIGLKLLDL